MNEKLVAIEVHPKAAEIAKARKTLDLCVPDRPVKKDILKKKLNLQVESEKKKRNQINPIRYYMIK